MTSTPHIATVFSSSAVAKRMLPVLFILLVSACAGPEAEDAAERPPNIIFIMADDLGYGDLEPYGQEKIHTPNLARMAREGLRFTQFYSGSTVCAPSRSVLMTGLHTGHTPIRGNEEVLPIGQAPLPDSTLTAAEVLKAAGYRTGAFGKWGLGGPGSMGVPTKQGFDEFFGYLCQRRAHFYYPEFLFRGGRGDTAQRVPLAGNVVEDAPRHPGAGPPVERAVYSHDRILAEALSFVEENQDRPFFLYLTPTIPHASLAVPDSALAPYLDEAGQSIFPETPFPRDHYTAQPMPHAAYAAMVTHLDRGVGRLLDTLRALGLEEHTIVLFTSDNGPHLEGGNEPQFFNSNGSLRGHKRDLYEGGIRMPMIVWAPGRVPAGTVSDRVWAMWDVLPTLADLADTAVPDSASIDGISFAPSILGHEQELEHDYLYWEFYEGQTAQAVREGPWKAVRIPMLTGEIELYNLQEDLDESDDVAAEHPEVVAEMRRLMEEAHTPSPRWQIAEK